MPFSRLREGTCVCHHSSGWTWVRLRRWKRPGLERLSHRFLIALHAGRTVCSTSVPGDTLAAREKPWCLHIGPCFVFHFSSYNASWLLFPCESTFIVKLLPRAQVLWKIRLQGFQSSPARSLCAWGQETARAAPERPLRWSVRVSGRCVWGLEKRKRVV